MYAAAERSIMQAKAAAKSNIPTWTTNQIQWIAWTLLEQLN